MKGICIDIRRLHQERFAAFREYIAAVHAGRSLVVKMDAPFLGAPSPTNV